MSAMSSSRKTSGSGLVVSIEEVHRVFNKFDENRDGKISQHELTKVMRELGWEPTAEELRTLMLEYDKDGDGHLNLEEFVEVMSGTTSKDLLDAFDLFDMDKDGRISKVELHRVLNRLGNKCSVDECVAMIRAVDADEDGYVNFEEFKKMMTKR